MKISTVALILSIFFNCFVFSFEKEEFADVREVTARKTFFYSENDDELNFSSPIRAVLLFYKEEKEVNDIKVGDQLQIKMKIQASEELDDGRMVHCFVSSDMHPEKERNIIYDACDPERSFIHNWSWSIKFQTFTADFAIVPLFSHEKKNINVTMACHAIVCRHSCPVKINNYCIKL